MLTLTLTGGFRPLHADRAEATSFLKSNWNKYEENYHPSYVLDDDEKTAWVEGVDGDGVGQALTVPLSHVARAKALKLQIRNGYQKSPKLLAANGAVKKATIVVLDGVGRESARQQVSLQRKPGFQDVVLELGGKGVASVRLVIDEVDPGTVYKDTCISDVRVFVDSEVPYNEKAERAKRAALLAWRKERLETARTFAKLPPTWPWAATEFSTIWDELHVSKSSERGQVLPAIAGGYRAMVEAKHPAMATFTPADHADLARLQRWRSGGGSPAAARRVEFTGRKPTLPDGLSLPDGLDRFLSKDGLVFTEPAAPGKARRAPVQHPFMGEIGTLTFSDAVVEGQDVFLSVTTTILERTETKTSEAWLLRYDEQGRLERFAFIGQSSETTGFMLEEPKPEDYVTTTTPGEQFGVLRLGRDAAGKVDAVELLRGAVDCGYAEDVPEGDEPCRFRVNRRRSTAARAAR
jgi:hypothetical protein